MGHVLLGERGIDEQTLYQLLSSTTSFALSGLYPTRYAYSSGAEYIVEAVTGTIWNSGYSVVSGYDSGAGGRTGVMGTENPRSFQIRYSDGTLHTFYIRNVADADNWGTPTLADWITDKVLK